MSFAQKIIVSVLVALLALLAAVVIFLTSFDWNRAKPWLNDRISDATGRPFAINGELALSWHRFDASQHGWRRWIPSPLLQAQQITVGNPPALQAEAATDENMAQARQVTFAIDLLPLLGRKIIIPNLVLDTPELVLRRTADGRNNWSLKSDGPSDWKFELDRLSINHGRIQLNDALHELDISAELDSLQAAKGAHDGPYGLSWQLKGKYNGGKLSGHGRAGAVLSLQDKDTPFPIDAEINAGKTHIAFNGKLTNPAGLQALDVHLKLSGASMAQLFPLTGIVLPETPPFATEGRLIGDLRKQQWTYQEFTGKVGSSDLAGTLEFRQAEPRPQLSGNLVSQRLVLADLAPLIGADSNADKARRDAPTVQPADKVLPVEKFKTKRWRTIDADVEFKGRKIVREAELPIEDLVTSLHLKDGVLSLTPLNFGMAGGDLRSDISLDGRSDPIKGRIKISARHLKLRQLLPGVEKMAQSLGEINGDAALSGNGNSIAALLGSANGEVKLAMNEGTVSKLLLEEAGLNIGNIVLTKLFGDEQVEINCIVGDFDMHRGVLQIDTLLADTKNAMIDVSGEVDMGNEQLALTLRPETKNLRLFSLRSPLYVSGSFKKPQVGVDAGVIALKAGSAIALGLAAPLAALLPLINASSNPENQCAQLLQRISAKPVAPAQKATPKAKPANK